MTDKELLEAAAKAAGYDIDHRASFRTWREYQRLSLNSPQGGHTLWNAFADDGDALRLAVKLRIEVEPWIHGDSACARAACREVLIDEPHYGDDPELATRRAIVRAAAATVGR